VRELSEQILLSRPVFIREVGLPSYAPVDPQLTKPRSRTERMSHVLVPLPFLARLVWPWPAAGCMLHLPLDLPTMTTLANPVPTLGTSYTSATYVVNTCSRYSDDRSLFQLPYQAGWQDLKDLFRSAGNIIRADINIGADGRPKGSGTVIFETSKDAQQAITMYNGFDWYGRTLEVREVG